MSTDGDVRLRAALASIRDADPPARNAARDRLAAAMTSPGDINPGATHQHPAGWPRRVAILAAVAASVVAVVVAVSVHGTTSPRPTGSYQVLDIMSRQQPSPRNAPQMAYFPPGREIVLFGGQAHSGKSLGDTWVFTRNGWRRLHPASSPPARAEGAMAYDPALRELILYGGCASCGGPVYRFLQDTWAFNGTGWTELHSNRMPDYEPSPTMSWDNLTGELELLAPPPGYGATPPDGNFNADTSVRLGLWAWTNTGWVWNGNVTGPPLTIQAPAFVAEPGTAQMLYYVYNPYSGSCPSPIRHCGADPHGLLFSQTWTWNGRSFTKDHPENAPTSSIVVVSDARIGRVVAVVGLRAWLWDGATWAAQAGLSTDFGDDSGSYDPALGDVVVLGTPIRGPLRSVTWVWDGSSWQEAVS
ncbi:MAG: kelch repeat-containing protein [Acidimicrobiales bacterium]